MRSELRLLAGAVFSALAILAAGCGGEADTFTIGVIVDCEGVLSAYAEDSLAGAELPLLTRGGRLAGRKPSDGVVGTEIAGRKVELRQGCGEVTYLTQLIEHARRLVEEEHADVVVAPMLGQTEGIVLRELARHYRDVAFVLANSKAQEPTLRDRVPNLFRFVADGAQSAAGLGSYAYRDLGWKTAAVVVQNNGYAWPEAAGFVAEFCALGGSVRRIPAPYDATASVAPRVGSTPDGVALFSAFFPDTLGFAATYAKAQPDLARRLVLGPSALTLADPKLFSQSAPLLRNVVVGGSASYDPAEPSWAGYGRTFKQHLPTRPFPPNAATAPLVIGFYNAVEATARALERVGEAGSGFMRALAETELVSPVGPVRLDGNRQAIVSAFLSQVVVGQDGAPGIRTLRVLKDVEQTFAGYFGPSTPTPTVSRPGCHAATPPPWAG